MKDKKARKIKMLIQITKWLSKKLFKIKRKFNIVEMIKN